MKDLPHHLKKLNTRILRSERRAENEENNYNAYIEAIEKEIFKRNESVKQRKKKEKLTHRKEYKTENLSHLGPEEKKRVPRFRERSHRPPMMH